MKTNGVINKVLYEEPEMEVVQIRLESRLLDGSTEQGQGCKDDECPTDL